MCYKGDNFSDQIEHTNIYIFSIIIFYLLTGFALGTRIRECYIYAKYYLTPIEVLLPTVEDNHLI